MPTLPPACSGPDDRGVVSGMQAAGTGSGMGSGTGGVSACTMMSRTWACNPAPRSRSPLSNSRPCSPGAWSRACRRQRSPTGSPCPSHTPLCRRRIQFGLHERCEQDRTDQLCTREQPWDVSYYAPWKQHMIFSISSLQRQQSRSSVMIMVVSIELCKN